jgi:prepilin-type N-terminal cleavage/methylation domain-containing protein
MVRCRANVRSGYTLVELVMSIAITAVLLGGTASAVLLASRALPDGDNLIELRLRTESAANQMTLDLLCAESFPLRSATGVEFTVADRNHGAAGAETIAYSWSGTAGDPLMRQYNSGTVVDVLADVREFELLYDVRTETETSTETVQATSQEAVLAYFDGWAGVTPADGPYSVMTSEYFVANFPDGVDQLRFTRAYLKMGQGPAASQNRSVAIHHVATPGSPEPGTNPIGTPISYLNEWLPVSPAWTEITFSDAVIDAPTSKEYCLVSTPAVTGAGVVVVSNSRNAPADVTVGLWSSDGGASWDPKERNRDENDIPFYVYGTYSTTSEEQVQTHRYFITGVTIKVRAGPDPAATVETGVQCLNAPEVASP